MKGIIEIENMEFYAFHGCFKEEQIVGNKFLVDVSITTDCTKAAASDRVKEALNYQMVYEVIKNEMAVKSHLLEHVASRMLDALFSNFNTIQCASVKISKVNPPLGGQVNKVSVTLKRPS
jgi:7,8-dihydroneopterin aldolase/epimerase/oxygenase